MPHSDPFETLLRQAARTAPMPPLPDGLLRHWQPRPARAGSPWLWLMPIPVFALGLILGAALAPTSSGAAMGTLKTVLAEVWVRGAGEASGWALALLLGVLVLLGDSLRVAWRRRR